MSVPSDRKYLKTHEWHKVDGGLVTLGITQFAADELTDVTYVALPAVGKKLAANDSFGEVESVKATSDLYTGVGGEVVEVNAALADDPSLVNTDPFEGGWMVKLRPDDPSQMDALLDVEAYKAATGQ